MASERRIGSEESATRERLLDAAEELLRTQGHSAVTVRRVAEQARLKRQLVHYYFRSMEELFVEVLRRAYERHARLHQRQKEREDEREMSELDDHFAAPSCQWPDFFSASTTSRGM